MTNVPLIDVAPARHGGRDERCRVAAAIDGACREIGFFAISGHGVPDRLVVCLMRLAAIALDVHETFFDDKVDRSIGTMRLNYYPGQTVPPSSGQLRASAHTDYGGFTILSGEDVPGGLQVRTRDGRWIGVPTSPTTFVVNIGDLLM